MPTAPYWGDLSGPKAARRQRRQSEDFSLPGRKSPDLEGPPNAALMTDKPLPPHPPKSNRTSMQTTNTEAVTESTLSPYASPTASNFADQGLAPRPPTFPYGESQYPDEQAERRQRRRRERNNETEDDIDHEYLSGPTPPAAPDVPKAPPVSFRHPYGNGGLPYTHTSPGPPRPQRQPSPLVSPDDEMNPEEYYKNPAPEERQQKQEEYPPLDRSQRTLDAAAEAPPPREPRDPQSSSRRRSTGGTGRNAQGRKASVGGSSRKFANDRSPLQRLELTLDSITKEEKRARVEAAERRAMEKAAAKAAQNPNLLQPPEPTPRAPPQPQEPQRPLPEPPRQPRQPQQPPPEVQQVQHVPVQQVQVHQAPVQQVRFRDDGLDEDRRGQQANVAARVARRCNITLKTTGDTHPVSRSMTGDNNRSTCLKAIGAMRLGHTRRKDLQWLWNRDILLLPLESRREALREEPREPLASSSGIPKRNLSFRERAAKDNMRLPQAAEQTRSAEASPQPTPPVSGSRRPSFSLTRSGSNKLKKQPKGDPWFNIRQDAERKYENIDFRNAALDQSAAEKGGPPVQRSVSHAAREQALPPDATQEEARRSGLPSKAARLIGLNFGGVQRRSTAPAAQQHDYESDDDDDDPRYDNVRHAPMASGGRGDDNHHTSQVQVGAHGRPSDREYYSEDDGFSDDSRDLYPAKKTFRPGEGIYKPPVYLDEWKKATVGSLSGAMLDLSDERLASIDKDAPWWEGGKRRGSTSRPRKAEAFDGEYDDTHAPTRFKPPLFLKCGPLLRYCGLKHEKVPARNRNTAVNERTIWRGSVMIVTLDSDSSYEIAPTLRLFVQPIELLPPPPQEILGEQGCLQNTWTRSLEFRSWADEERHLEHLDEAKDLSRDETDNGLFEKTRSPPDYTQPDGSPDLPGSFASRRKRVEIDGEKVSKYKDVRGFRLHAERGCTFWRFNIEIELRDNQQRIAYRINRGPAMGFWVPALGESMNIMFHSCNGFSASVNPDDFSGPDPMWRDVLNTHQSQPFHVMIGGGDQIYNDCLMDQSKQFREWLMIKNPLHKHNSPFTPTMQDELERAYLERYCMWFSQGLFGLANSQIPMVNMWDDHDISDGFGSYAHHDMNSPVFSGLGNVAYKYYMLFQQQSIPTETEASEPSWVLGSKPGPYISELSRSLFVELGSKVSLLAVDGRTERTELDVVSEPSWQRIMDRCYDELRNGRTEHLLVLLGVPIAYPRLVWLENILTSRAMDPSKPWLGMLGNTLNHIDGGVEVLDDLNDHWTAKNHKKERTVVLQDMQDLAADKSVRVTFLSGDVHLAAVGQFYANPKLGLPKHKDFRYMPNIISSAIVNTPPPDLMADILNKRNKIHHFDESTEEDMIPLFQHGVDGKARNNKHLLPHRNWCSIRAWTPGTTPPPTPPLSAYDRSPSPPASRGGLLRRFSSNRGPAYRPDVQQDARDESRSRPPISNKALNVVDSQLLQSPGSKKSQPDDGGINGQWGDDDRDDESVDDGFFGYEDEHDRGPAPRSRGMGLRGGGHDEYQSGDDSYFTARPAARMSGAPNRAVPRTHDEFQPGDETQFSARAPARSYTTGDERQVPRSQDSLARPKPFHRTPTGLSVKQKKKAEAFEVDLEGGLDICLNVEVNQKDPAGITVPYRLLVPRLVWDDAKEAAILQPPAPAGFKRLFSLKKKDAGAVPPQGPASEERFEGSIKQQPAAPPAGREPIYDAPPGTRDTSHLGVMIQPARTTRLGGTTRQLGMRRRVRGTADEGVYA
ncbi:LOW QUALITY PROTEIN: hypothetical protein Ct61P_09726 [Colletotrichum tofieldiae]|nr:LOW QUALITY PROTEIN: hypothetical protein Ct61P_09726 [Colletotrichum tofieldiae]